MGGTVSGSLWGLVLGGVGLAVVSQLNELPAGNTPPVMPQLSAPEVAQADTTPEGLTPDAPPVAREFALSAPRVGVPEAEVEAPATDTTPSTPPQTPDLATALTVPESVTNPQITAGLDEPQISRQVISSPAVPAPEQDVVIATRPSQAATAPAAPDTTEVAGLAEDAAITPAPETQVIEETAVPETPAPAADASPAPVPADEQPPAVADEPSPRQATDVADATPAPVLLAPANAPEPEQEEVADTPTEPAPVAVTEATQPPAPRLNTGVRINRPGAEPSETAGQDSEIISAAPLPEDASALVRYATAFEVDEALPLLSLLLIDSGASADAVQLVAGLPFPVTVVIDALAEDANARMRAYRDAGIEVALQTSLPMGAVPTDVEVAFEAAFDILPETVALFSGGEGILQNNRAVAGQVIQVLESEGRGLVVVQRGFGNAIRGAQQAGLPALSVLRDLDGEGEDPAAIARALDQSAFRARQSGDAVLLARVVPATMEALRAWGAENDGNQIALAPVSAILKGDIDIDSE